ncbi:molybdopterin-dependent oxidoreductase [Luteipulveratus sp. YIM 133132]|uniref:molybdopterin-dependent oxidoreductase n=1 Tax=Luteipulveratus flavus TaxID=3031728 RepID=UPI0023AEFC7E|nr:molybdopterin-dependent oxidoreductase [Luteipulveratus sp. YIM 133132]MDE9364755.1 molybdopterin-dependent oxidoreductase [Luteipulveratus sp. YIM 133132]
MLPRPPEEPPSWWPSAEPGPTRGGALTARLGVLAGSSLLVCFVTGLISHYLGHPWSWLPPPARPAWLYRLTQGIHVITGIATIPLVLAKLWSVQHRLRQWPPARSVAHAAERASVGLLVAAVLLELVTGLLNVLQYYPWPWDFVAVHFATAWLVIGSVALHVAVQLPAIRDGLATPLSRRGTGRGLSRRGVLGSIGLGVGTVVATTVGQVVGPLAPLALLAPRRPDRAPDQDLPVNRTAAAAGVGTAARASTYRLKVRGRTERSFTVSELESLPSQRRSLPIVCVEGWSRNAHWQGPSLLDLVASVGGDASSQVTVASLEDGPYAVSSIRDGQLRGALLATHLNGQRLSLDHGYPVRLIALGRTGEQQTKWVTRIEVS